MSVDMPERNPRDSIFQVTEADLKSLKNLVAELDVKNLPSSINRKIDNIKKDKDLLSLETELWMEPQENFQDLKPDLVDIENYLRENSEYKEEFHIVQKLNSYLYNYFYILAALSLMKIEHPNEATKTGIKKYLDKGLVMISSLEDERFLAIVSSGKLDFLLHPDVKAKILDPNTAKDLKSKLDEGKDYEKRYEEKVRAMIADCRTLKGYLLNNIGYDGIPTGGATIFSELIYALSLEHIKGFEFQTVSDTTHTYMIDRVFMIILSLCSDLEILLDNQIPPKKNKDELRKFIKLWRMKFWLDYLMDYQFLVDGLKSSKMPLDPDCLDMIIGNNGYFFKNDVRETKLKQIDNAYNSTSESDSAELIRYIVSEAGDKYKRYFNIDLAPIQASAKALYEISKEGSVNVFNQTDNIINFLSRNEKLIDNAPVNDPSTLENRRMFISEELNPKITQAEAILLSYDQIKSQQAVLLANDLLSDQQKAEINQAYEKLEIKISELKRMLKEFKKYKDAR